MFYRLIVQPILWLSYSWNRAHGSRAAQQRLLEAKERALRQQELIAAAAARMAAQEEAQNGLIIVRVPSCLSLSIYLLLVPRSVLLYCATTPPSYFLCHVSHAVLNTISEHR